MKKTLKRLLRRIKNKFNIKRKIAFKKFDRECLHVPCTVCPHHNYGDAKCEIAIKYGLEEM